MDTNFPGFRKEVMRFFKPFKTTGILNALLRKSLDKIMTWLLRIFKGSVASWYIQSAWIEATAALISKAGKIKHWKRP